MPLRSLTELFALAERARDRDDLEHGAVGARGHGFVLADQLETERFPAGGSKLANLPSYTETGLAAHAVGLVRGRARIKGHIEELFELTLCAVSPRGGRRTLSYYHGPSGHALGSTSDEGLDDDDGEALAAVWEEALRKAPPMDFQISVDSDFGRSWLVVERGGARHHAARRGDVPALPPLETDDAAALARALEPAGGGGCAAFDGLHTAWRTTSEAVRAPLEPAYRARLDELWGPALDELEAAYATADDQPLPRAVELAAGVLMFPETFQLDRARQDRLWDRRRELEARRRSGRW